MTLETRALHWLMYVRNCHFALRERSPRGYVGEPDALGVTTSRLLIEVEVKRSMSDFRQNRFKWQIAQRDLYIAKAPWEYYYMVPAALVAKVKPELPLWAGLLSDAAADEKCFVTVEVEAMKNNESKRLSVKECVRLARCMANYVCWLEKRHDGGNEWHHHCQGDGMVFEEEYQI